MGGTPGKWNTAPKKGGEVLPSPAAAALLPGTVSLGLGPVEAVGGGSRTALYLLFARVCTSVLLGILGCQAANFRLSLISPLGTCPCHVAATCFASLLLPVTFPRARGSTQGCSVPEAALPTSPHVVGLIKVSVFCTGDCVGLRLGLLLLWEQSQQSQWPEPSAQGRGLVDALAVSVVDLVLALKLILYLTA